MNSSTSNILLAPFRSLRDTLRVPFPATSNLYARLDKLAAPASPVDVISLDPENPCLLKRYRLRGPKGGSEPLKIAIFAGIHGDEIAGPKAVAALLEALVANSELARGYDLYAYPVCNPHGFDHRIRCSASGKDLNREFWRDSDEIEVRILEEEIQREGFQGLISFHADDTSDGLYGFVRGAVLTRSLLEPALAAAEKFLPRNLSPLIDGFPAQNGIISECYDGILTAPPRLQGTPFEIILETPQQAPVGTQTHALVAATLAVLAEYPKFISFAADL